MYMPFIKDWEETRANKDTQSQPSADKIRAMRDKKMVERVSKLYRKKPVVIEAIQYTGKNKVKIQHFMGRYLDVCVKGLKIPTLEGDMFASVGDYIIKGVKGEFYPCKPDIFEQTYEEIDHD